MPDEKLTLGRAIDQIIEALTSFDDKDRNAILGTVCSHLEIELLEAKVVQRESAQARSDSSTSTAKAEKKAQGCEEAGIDIRTLKDQKKPNSARQMACLVAYYLQEHAPTSERKDNITTADVEKYFKQAGFKLPEKMEQLLADSKRSGYFDSAKRGEYSLTRVGYNLVTHSMPSKNGG